MRRSNSSWLRLLLAVTATLLLAACGDSSRVLDAAASFAGEVAEVAGGASELDVSNLVAALPGANGKVAESPSAELGSNFDAPSQRGARTYYQFIDDSGSVRFVSSLDEVPMQWRDRAGTVVLSSPPPTSPADRQADFERRKQRARAVLAAAEPARRQGGSEVQLYYAEWCPYCRKAKSYLEERGVDYVLRDVDDPDIMAELKSRTGSGSIPVIDIDGELVRGFSPSGIDRLLAKR